MSVPVYKRNESKIEFYHTFVKMRKYIIILLMRDFGVKARTYSVHLLEDIYKMDEEDKVLFENLSNKYGIDSASVDKYPEWLLNGWRNEIMAILNNLGIEIFTANNIYITNLQEYYNRRMHWNNAIGYCFALQDKLHEIIDCISVKLGAYEEIFEILAKEIKLLKSVRKSDNKYLRKMEQNAVDHYRSLIPYFNDSCYVYNNYPNQPFAPNYCSNSNVVQRPPVVMVEMCKIVGECEA